MRVLLRAVLAGLVALVLAGCGDDAVGPAVQQEVTLAELPNGVGRGFPSVVLLHQEGDAARRSGLLQSGQPAPDFAFALEDGRAVRLSDLQGAAVVINFWATWCGPCREEMPHLVEAAREHGVTVLAVNVQEARGPVEEFAREFAMELPVVLDGEGKLQALYGVPGLPTTYFVGADGAIASLVIGQLMPDVLAERLAEIQ